MDANNDVLAAMGRLEATLRAAQDLPDERVRCAACTATAGFVERLPDGATCCAKLPSPRAGRRETIA